MEKDSAFKLVRDQFICFVDETIPNSKLTRGSHNKGRFRCKKCGKVFVSAVKDVYNSLCRSKNTQTTGCSYCSGRKVCRENSYGSIYPQFAKFWNQEKNGDITPHDIVPGTDNKYWHTCQFGHDFYPQISNITKQKRGRWCPICKLRGTSRLEIMFFVELSKIFNEENVIWQKKSNYSKETFGVEIDIIIKEKTSQFIPIEIDSSIHKSFKSLKRDLKKKQTRKR